MLLMQLTVLLCMCKQMVEQAESVRCGLLGARRAWVSGLNKYLTYRPTPGKYYTGTSILALPWASRQWVQILEQETRKACSL